MNASSTHEHRVLQVASSPDVHDEQQLLTWVPRLRRYARALSASRDDADDLVQDTVERAWAKSGLWSGVVDMQAWLFSIMHNVHVDTIRRPRISTITMDDDTPEVALARTQGERLAVLDLQAALDLLPVEQEKIVLLVGLEDMAYADVSKTLGIPIGTVMSRLSRGRERLRALMEGRDEPVPLKVVK